ncbi:hypothetical protein S40288_11419 [Stachybotrys chartarum IBT 40288]|nr:hypothetical protein S40288_11419 [Stachybotrys chartarum IBT 40288]
MTTAPLNTRVPDRNETSSGGMFHEHHFAKFGDMMAHRVSTGGFRSASSDFGARDLFERQIRCEEGVASASYYYDLLRPPNDPNTVWNKPDYGYVKFDHAGFPEQSRPELKAALKKCGDASIYRTIRQFDLIGIIDDLYALLIDDYGTVRYDLPLS